MLELEMVPALRLLDIYNDIALYLNSISKLN